MEVYVHEFLYRGRASDEKEPSAFHVILGMRSPNPHRPSEMVTSFSDALTAEQAEELGFPASVLVKGVNDAALAEVAVAHEAVQAAIADANAERQARIAAEDQIAELQAELAALNNAVVSDRGFSVGPVLDGSWA
ncbi:hypothetical protein [Rhizobium sp. 9140]|uniref:hypothetical protein n=1 Tax=Rhizobium sp. 9140 TaxID=1761900 RepID=UPI00079214E5|nr:hypothetical protein [Rhizobium sp. 9140]CZT36242.1 hypothetical protein GA0004734_00032420 [Rhizobium sp. 9140]